MLIKPGSLHSSRYRPQMTWLEFIYEVGGAISLWSGYCVLDALVAVIGFVKQLVKAKLTRHCLRPAFHTSSSSSLRCPKILASSMAWALCIVAGINAWNVCNILDYFFQYPVGTTYEPVVQQGNASTETWISDAPCFSFHFWYAEPIENHQELAQRAQRRLAHWRQEIVNSSSHHLSKGKMRQELESLDRMQAALKYLVEENRRDSPEPHAEALLTYLFTFILRPTYAEKLPLIERALQAMVAWCSVIPGERD